MSYADVVLMKRFHDALKGFSDENEEVRPKWADGTPAHTYGSFSSYSRYDLGQGFPICASRKINAASAVDEILWIYQKKSNDVHELNSHVWDQWADKNGKIGKAYGFQVAKKYDYPEGRMDQLDHMFYLLKTKPADRRMVLSLWNPSEQNEMALPPCVWSFQLRVQGDKLNMALHQRSNDLVAAGSWNVVQYSALLEMIAKVFGYKPGVLAHDVADSHVYDRHIPFVIDISLSRAQQIVERLAKLDETTLKNSNLSENEQNTFRQFQKAVLAQKKVNFAKPIEEAEELERKIGDYETGKIKFSEHPINFGEYISKILASKEFKLADVIVETMSRFPKFDAMLGYSNPTIVLDDVKDFYDYPSPKMKSEDGKFVDNPNSKFKVDDYHPEIEGKKLQVRVPVAE